MITEEICYCQPSWVMQSDTVRMAVTHLGAHMAPVEFCQDAANPIQPYYVSPWQCEDHAVPSGQSEAVLRGDFFCLPFGFAEREMRTPSHGRTAGARWSLQNSMSKDGVHELCIDMKDALHSAKVTRQYFLKDGENVVYDQTTIEALEGMYTLGHHAVLRVPAMPSSLLLSTSQQLYGMTYPFRLDESNRTAPQSLAVGASFLDLRSVPALFGDASSVDCSAYPSRQGFADLVQVGVQSDMGQPAWTTAVNTDEGYLWFSLRNAEVLPSTIIWMENQGRHGSPWAGRNCSLGLEDVCSYFDTGSKISGAANAFSARGIKTVQEFRSDVALKVHYAQGAVQIPMHFGRVCTVHCDAKSATFTDFNGLQVSVAVSVGFLFGEAL
jgi:hypothetical protein